MTLMDTNEDTKMLLLKDLCSRLPYEVKVSIKNSKNYSPITVCEVTREYICVEGSGEKCFSHGAYQLYLRPMSSMTEEESKEFALLQTDFYVDGFLYPIAAINMINWLNSHYFDYCGLIERGLALEAPEGMYN